MPLRVVSERHATTHTEYVLAVVDQLRRDAASWPNGFQFLGPVPIGQLDEWSDAERRVVPRDLVELWALTGGGELFETEELLCPGARDEYEILRANAWLWRDGLPRDLLVFHRGLDLTAVTTSGTFLRLDQDTYIMRRALPSLDKWYPDLRREYGETYGLTCT